MKNDKLRDALMSASADETARACMATADALQSFTPPVQLAALGYCFLTYARLTKIPVQDVFAAAGNIAHESAALRPEFRAFAEYLKNETLGEHL